MALKKNQSAVFAGVLGAALIGLPLLGAILGFWWGSQPTAPGFSIGAPPEPIEHIASAHPLGIIVKTLNGDYYRCADLELAARANCWKKLETFSEDTASDSNNSIIDPARFAPPPRAARAQRTTTSIQNITGRINATRYTLLDDGTIWVSQARASALFNPSKRVDQIFGASVGLCCAGALGSALVLLCGLVFYGIPQKNGGAAA